MSRCWQVSCCQRCSGMSGILRKLSWVWVVFSAAACSLNPQVEPPSSDTADKGHSNDGGNLGFSGGGGAAGFGGPVFGAGGTVSQGGAFGNGGYAQGVGGASSAGAPGGQDAGALPDGAVPPPTDAGDGGPDAGRTDAEPTKDARRD